MPLQIIRAFVLAVFAECALSTGESSDPGADLCLLQLKAASRWPHTGRTTWKYTDVPPAFSGQKKRVPVLFSVQTSRIPVYESKLKAEYDTWLGAIPVSERLVLGPRCGGEDEPRCEPEVMAPSVCEEESNWCKAAAVLDKAFQEVDFDWLLQAYEDTYIDTEDVKAALEGLDPSIPVIYSGFGCGSTPAMRDWYQDQSLTPSKIQEKNGFCDAILQKGGICGGYGIIFSRALVSQLFAEGREEFWHRVYGLREDLPCDVAMSCFLYQRNFTNFDVSLQPKLQGGRMVASGEKEAIKQAKKLGKSSNGVFHIVGDAAVGDAMRELDRVRRSEERKELRK